MKIVIGLAALTCAAAAAEPPAALDRLAGDWVGTGKVEGEPVRYILRGERVLMGEFMRLSIVDAAKAPAYEAQVFIAKSKTKGDLVAHWLDNFGADGARTVGFGEERPDGFDLQFDYGGSVFRDYFRFDPGGDRFTLVVDSCAPSGDCENFADYVFDKRK